MTKAATEEDVVQLYGNLFRVRRALLTYADPEEGPELKFRNPRHTIVHGVPTGMGLKKEEMDELRESIRTQGLQHPLVVRGEGNLGAKVLTVVNGERRLRAIDGLLKANAECLNLATGKFEPAKAVFEYLECRVLMNIDDKEAYRYAFQSNGTSIGIGEGATMAMIKEWRKAGWSDQDILGITGKSVTWLRDSDQLLTLDDKVFDAFNSGEINRTVAIELSKVDDVKDRLARFYKTREFAAKRIGAIQTAAAEKLEAAEAAADIAEGQVADAKALGDKKLAEQAAKTKRRMDAKLERAAAKAAAGPKVKANSNDLRAANSEMESDDGKALTVKKLEKFWIPTAEGIIGYEGKNEKGEDMGVDVEDARLARQLVLQGIMKGERDLLKLLRAHKRNREARQNKK